VVGRQSGAEQEVSMEKVAQSEADSGNTSGGLSRRLSELQQLSSRDLRTEWRRLFRSNPPNLSRDLLVRAIAYRVQELAHGGLSKATARKLATLAAEFGRDGQISADARPQIKPGARLVREWRGRTHVVTVMENGFTYGGNPYPSLTRIALEITGAHWSGPRFFGLVKRPAESGARNPLPLEARHGQA
jgi:hypothetical protein